MRFGETVQRASKQYHCDHCGYTIVPGDTYERAVWMPMRGMIHVLRSHVDPNCPHPEDEECTKNEEFVPLLLAA
jgi:hypothetical protein